MEGNTLKKPEVEGRCKDSSLLLELSAINDLAAFKQAVEEGHDVNQSSVWYGRKLWSNKMGLEERTPLMIASMFGSLEVLSFIIQTGLVDVNRACGSDGATALHCAAAGGSSRSVEVVRLLIDSSADINCVDACGIRPCDMIARSWGSDSSSKSKNKILKIMLSRDFSDDTEVVDFEEVIKNLSTEAFSFQPSNDGRGTDQKKEYPFDPSLPDIKNGFYITDEFRMYMFKVKPCSRAYSHDWTECPFVHPGENARRRDPRKYNYTCVPCPEFRKGACNKGDACDFAHGIFESWLHPAQYRTRLCKDETTCARRVCFFAHKSEELRALDASTGSALSSSPRSRTSVNAPFDLASSISPLALGSPSVPMMPASSTPPMTPTSSSSSPMGANLWVNNITPPTLQLAGSRLRTSLNARDVGLQAELQGLEQQMRRQQLLEELAGVSSPLSRGESGRFGGVRPSKLDELYGSSSLDHNMLPQSPPGMMWNQQNMSQPIRSSFSSTLCTSPRGGSSASFRMDSSGVSNPRLAAFARSQSFIERGGSVNQHSGMSMSPSSPSKEMGSPHFVPDWGSSEGKSVWGVQEGELNKLRKSASFGYRSSGNSRNSMNSSLQNDPRVQSFVKDPPKGKSMELGVDEVRKLRQHYLNNGGSEVTPSWLEQMYMEQEQMVA